MEYIRNKNGWPILMAMVRAIQENKTYLGEIDGLIGDGDHGANMNKGFSLFASGLYEDEISFSDGLNELGMVLLNEIGGSMGPIYGTIFMEMGEQAEALDKIALNDFRNMLEAGLDGLKEIVEAQPGDKTLIDTLSPAVCSLRDSAGKQTSFGEALELMELAAEEGKDATKDMTARFGRSSRLGERSRGVLDAGAVSCFIILQAMAEAMMRLLES